MATTNEAVAAKSASREAIKVPWNAAWVVEVFPEVFAVMLEVLEAGRFDACSSGPMASRLRRHEEVPNFFIGLEGLLAWIASVDRPKTSPNNVCSGGSFRKG